MHGVPVMAFAVAVVGSSLGGGPISSLPRGVTSRVRLRCHLQTSP